MRSRWRRVAANIAVLLATGVAASLAHGQVYKCKDDAGRTTYSDTPCVRGGKPLAIPNAAPEIAAGSPACAQLHDELSRLAAAEANGKRPSQRRIALHRQYESRCIGISRAPPENK